jgi:drug/metabolite transporter (DMT)-like permease
MDSTTKNDGLGAIYILTGAVSSAFGALALKHLATDLGWGQIVVLRHAVALPFFLPLFWRLGPRYFVTKRPLSHLMRGVFGAFGFILFVLALINIPVGDAVTLSYTTPFWSLGLAVIAFGERFGPARVLATAVGFAGVILIARPGSAEIGDLWFVGVALFSAFLTSLAMMMVKRLSASEPPDRIAFLFLCTGVLCGTPFAIFDWQPIALAHVPWIVATGACAAVSQWGLSRGYAIGTFSKMAPLAFAQVAVATLGGVLMFDEVPRWTTLAGMVLIGIGTVWVVRDRSDRSRGDVTSRRSP